MIANIIAFLSSISAAILVGAGLAALNIKNKKNTRLEELTNTLTSLITISNTQSQYINFLQRFSNIQESYYIYKQNYTAFLHEQTEALALITNLRKLIFAALVIWAVEALLILISGKNFLEYALATLIISVIVAVFIKFFNQFNLFVQEFSTGIADFPKPDALLTPTNLLTEQTALYLSPQLPLNFMESGMSIELDAPKNPEEYTLVKEDEKGNEYTLTDFSEFTANGRMLFSFQHNFKGELHFHDKNGDDGKTFAVSSDFFKAGFSNIYDISFTYHTPLHHLSQIIFIIFSPGTSDPYAKITFPVAPYDELPTQSIILSNAVATKFIK